jgi:small subunit ribosomal protein S1
MSSDRPGDSFAALFEQSATTMKRKPPKVGEVIDAVVVQIGRDAVFFELDGKRQAFIEAVELRAPDGTMPIAVGETVRARVVDVAGGDVRLTPVARVEAAPGVTLVPEQVVTATVERVESYGIFVQVEGTKGRGGRGLIPNVELGTPRGADVRKAFPAGTKVTAKILEVGEGKLRLSIRGAKDDAERKDAETFREKAAAAPAPQTLGTFGDLLKSASAKSASKKHDPKRR